MNNLSIHISSPINSYGALDSIVDKSIMNGLKFKPTRKSICFDGDKHNDKKVKGKLTIADKRRLILGLDESSLGLDFKLLIKQFKKEISTQSKMLLRKII